MKINKSSSSHSHAHSYPQTQSFCTDFFYTVFFTDAVLHYSNIRNIMFQNDYKYQLIQQYIDNKMI